MVSLLLVIQTLLERRSAVKEKEEPSALLAEVDLSFPLDLAMAVVRLARSAIVVDLATFLVVGLATFLVVDLASSVAVVDLAKFAPFYQLILVSVLARFGPALSHTLR